MSLVNSGPKKVIKIDVRYINTLLNWQNQHLTFVQDNSVHLENEIQAEEADYIDETMLEETLTQLDENESLVTLILTQWNRVRVFLDGYANQKLDANKQQEKNIDRSKKELQQEKDQNEILTLERDALLKKYHHPWVC